MDEKEIKRKNSLLIIFVIILVILIIGVTYAAFQAISGGNVNTINTGSITMSYSEPTNALILNNALPMSDIEGKAQTTYFEFNVSSYAKTNANDNTGVEIPYEINISKSDVDPGKEALADNDIKVYLTEVIAFSETERTTPVLVSTLNSSSLQTGRIVIYETSDIHKNNSSAKVRAYRLRAWIKSSFNTELLNNDTYQYKFTVNVNAQIDALGS